MSFLRAGEISINIFKRLQDLGFSEIENFQELIDNSIDSKAKNISIIIKTIDNIPNLYFTDDGLGMDGEGQVKYYNVAGDKSQELYDNHIGSKGMGGKIAAINLSNRGNVDIISRTSPDNWAESSYNWQSPNYIGNVMVSTKKSIDDAELVEHIFQDLLQINVPHSFTVIFMKLDKTIYDTLFMRSPLDAKKSLAFHLGITYYTHLQNGINITIIHDEKKQNIVPIPINITKKTERFFPENIDQIIKVNHKTQKEGDADITKFIENISLPYERNFILYTDDSVIEIDNDQNYYLFHGTYRINQHSNIRYKEKKNIDINTVLSDELIRFTIKHTFYADIIELRKKIESEFLDNTDLDENTVQEIFYGCHLKRNDKIISDPAIEYKDIKSGTYYTRLFNHSQFLIEYKVGPHDHDIDKQFGIMVNKSCLNKSSIHLSIIKLINYLYYENHQLLNDIIERKIEDFKLIYPKIEQEQSNQTKKTSNPLPILQIKPFQQNTEKDTEDKEQTDESVTDTDDIEVEIEIKDNIKKSRKKLSKNLRTRIIELQEKKEKITGITFGKYIRSEIDHIDGNPGNNEDINLQAISPNLHSLKTNDPITYQEISQNPHIYNITVALAHLDSPLTLSNLSRANQTKLLKFRKFLKTLI